MATVVKQGSVITVDDTLFNVQNAGQDWSLTQVGTDSYRFEVRAGDTWMIDPSTKNRSEISMRTDIAEGNAINVSYKMTIDPGAANTASFTTLGQFHQSESGGGQGLAPPFAIGLQGENMVITVAYRDATGKDVVETIFTDKAPVSRGSEYAFNIQATFDPDGSAHLVVVRNGVTIADYSGKLGWPGQTGVYWKEGIYRSAAPETLAVTYSGLDIATKPVTIPPAPTTAVTYNQYDGNGKIAATVTTQPNGDKLVQSFDASGSLTKVVDSKATGELSITNYGIIGKSYVSETTQFDASGKIVALTGRHADGSLDYQQFRNADGSLDNWQYDAKGAVTRHEAIASSGVRDVYEYAIAGNATPSSHRSYDAQGVLRLMEQKYADGTLSSSQSWNSDGSTLLKTYSNAGVLTQSTFVAADGSKDISVFGITGKSYVSTVSHYDAKGLVTAIERTHADGSLDYSYVKDASGTTTKTFNAAGLLTKTEIVATSGARDVYDYAAPGSKYETTHRSYDAQGVLRLMEQKYADGTLSSSQSWNSDGSTLLKAYSSAGVLTQSTFVAADGSKDISAFGITGKSYVSTVSHYDAGGVVTAIERKHADGSLDYSYLKDASGTTTKTFNAAGLLTKTEVVATSGARDAYDYTTPGSKYEALHRSYDAQGVMRLYEQKNADGSLDYVKSWKTDGSVVVTDYDSTGQFLSATRTNAAGIVDYAQTKVSDGTLAKFYDAGGLLTKTEQVHLDQHRDVYDYGFASKTVASAHRTYDAVGKLVVYETYFSTGKLDLSQVWNADGSMTTKDYDSAGKLVSTVELRADGSHTTFFDAYGTVTKSQTVGLDGTRDVYDYGVTGTSYAAVHRVYDAGGSLALYEQRSADGQIQTSKVWNADGSTKTSSFDSDGLLSVARIDYPTISSVSTAKFAVAASADMSAGFTGEAALKSSLLSYDKAGQLLKQEDTLSDGGRNIFDYNITGRSYVASERQYDASGTLIAMTMTDAAGNKLAAGYASGAVLHSGTGNDLFAVSDGDTIVFNSHFGNDTVRNFHAGDAGHDVLAMDHSMVQDFDHLVMEQKGDNVVITVADHGVITLEHVQLANLNHSDFVFF